MPALPPRLGQPAVPVLSPGQEIIMPSFTFVSTACVFALCGPTPVYVDVEAGFLNFDPDAVEQANTSNTKAIVVVLYARIACDMVAIMDMGLGLRLGLGLGKCTPRLRQCLRHCSGRSRPSWR